jgi:hypothetical protein
MPVAALPLPRCELGRPAEGPPKKLNGPPDPVHIVFAMIMIGAKQPQTPDPRPAHPPRHPRLPVADFCFLDFFYKRVLGHFSVSGKKSSKTPHKSECFYKKFMSIFFPNNRQLF